MDKSTLEKELETKMDALLSRADEEAKQHKAKIDSNTWRRLSPERQASQTRLSKVPVYGSRGV